MLDTPASKTRRLADAVISGELGALARAITLAENQLPGADQLLNILRPQAKGVPVIGVTGAPGAGKSTLIDVLITEWRQQDKTVAVLAVDPSSPLTGGAVLGDRVRMGRHSQDAGVFIRSLSARGMLGGLSSAIVDIIDTVDAGGWDLILIETVGAGQSETDIAAIADIKLMVAAPGLGDDIQAIKAGILEIADILVVNKADRDGACETEKQLNAMLALRVDQGGGVVVAKTVATRAEGVAELCGLIGTRMNDVAQVNKKDRHRRRLRAALIAASAEWVRQRLQDDAIASALLDQLGSGELSLREAVPLTLEELSKTPRSDDQ